MPRPHAPVFALLLLAMPAHADEPACPLDMFDAASGTLSTWIGDTMVAAASATPTDPTADGEPAPSPPSATPAQPPPRPSGRYASISGALGVRSDAREGEHRSADAWLDGSATLHAGWRRGPKVCASTHALVGTESQVESSLGFAIPFFFVSIAVGGEQRWHVRPSLASPRIWLRRAFVESRIHAQMSFATWEHADGAVSAVVPFRVETAARRQLDAPPDRGVAQRVAFSMYEYAGAATRVEVLRLALDLYYPDGIPPEIMPDHIERRPPISMTRLDPLVLAMRRGALELELDAGVLQTDDALDCRACAPVAGTLSLGTTRGDDRWEARYDRDAHLAFDARIAVEDRVTLRYRRALGEHGLRADGFAALTRTNAPGEREPVATGGVAVGLDAALGHGIALAVDVEAGRSYYARFDGDPMPVPEPVARLGVALSRRFGD